MYKRLRPVRAKVWANGWLLLLPLQGVGYGDMAPRALPWARDLLPFQGARGEGCGDSTVAHFACKVRGTKVAAIARAENPTKSCPRALVMFATCSWPSLCEQSELQCWRRNRRLCGPAQFSAARALPPNLILSGFLTPYLSEAFAARTCSEGLRRSTVAHFARKVRGTNIVAAKHVGCSKFRKSRLTKRRQRP